MRLSKVRDWINVLITISLLGCTHRSSDNKFEISGTIRNDVTLKKVYLEELPAATSQGKIVDSSDIGKDGQYKLKGNAGESAFYAILPTKDDELALASLINDVPNVTVNIILDNKDNRFSESYEVRGSPASQGMKDFVMGIDPNLQKIYLISLQADSLKKLNTPDSLMQPLMTEWKTISDQIKDYSITAINKANDPALFIFELGYFQKIADRFGLQALNPDEEIAALNKAVEKFPAHTGLAEIKKRRDEEVAAAKKMTEPKWLGKQAPDFSLPDANGKEVKLSSFRGKYVLVDFWASWCMPCRAENPNVVKAYSRFKDKNFSILGVSLDNPGEKSNWLTAVKKDNLNWTQVSDLKGWQSIVVSMYDFGEVGIPYNILLDPDGVVIGERLKGPALESKLEEVLK